MIGVVGNITENVLCVDCVGILDQVQQLEDGTYAEPPQLPREADPSKQFVQFATVDKFKESDYYRNVLPEDSSLPHKTSREQLAKSAQNGCQMCTWFLTSLNSNSEGHNSSISEFWQRRPVTVAEDPVRSPLGARCIGHYYVRFICKASDTVYPGVSLTTGGWPDSPRHVQVVNRGDEVASMIIDSAAIATRGNDKFLESLANLDDHASSGPNWDLFKCWMDDCLEEHAQCHIETDRDLEGPGPTFLLDIRDVDVVRLVPCPKDVPRYSTLSYCHGAANEPQLNQSTIINLSQGVSTGSFPATFRDAVLISQKLNIPYIWIDTLCVMQDSYPEREQKPAKVAAVFGNSYLCISATLGPDNTTPLLDIRSLTHSRPLVHGNLIVQEDLTMKNNNLAMRQITQCDRIRTLTDWAIEASPLYKITGAIRERTYAPRILHCTSDEFIWECTTGMRSESHPLLTNGGSVVKEARKQTTEPTTLLTDEQRVQNQLDKWRDLVTIYSAGSVSHLEDKLSFCSEIANEMQPILGSYVAGLWKDYLPSQLLWYHTFCCPHAQDLNHRQMHPKIQPSWSWISLNCGVQYENVARNRTPDTAQTLIKIHDIDMVYRENDVVESGMIHLTGQLYPIYKSLAWGYMLDTTPPDFLNPKHSPLWCWDIPEDFASSEEEKEIMRATMTPKDELEEKTLWYGSVARFALIHEKRISQHHPTLTKVCALPVMRAGGKVICLLLEHTGTVKGLYKRVGYFDCRSLGDLETLEKSPKEMQDMWPSAEEYTEEEGYTISLI